MKFFLKKYGKLNYLKKCCCWGFSWRFESGNSIEFFLRKMCSSVVIGLLNSTKVINKSFAKDAKVIKYQI